LFHDDFSFLAEIFLKSKKCFDALTETRAGELLVDLSGFGLLTF